MQLPIAGLSLACLVLVLLLFLATKFKLPVKVSQNGATTPPGSWRIPLLGETLHFLKDPHRFYLDHISRYGDIFCTSLFGENCIVVTTPEASKWVLQSGQKFFKPGYPQSANSLIDPSGSFTDELHTLVRRVVGSCLHPESLQHHVNYIDSTANSILDSWQTPAKTPINVYQEMAKYTFFVTMKVLCGMEPGPLMETMFQDMQDFEKAFLTLHINLPFTTYRKGLKARDRLFHAVEIMIRDRRQAARGLHSDMLESIVGSAESSSMTDVHVRAIIMTILLAGHETSAAQLVWAIKRLHDNPKLLRDVQAEHEGIKEQSHYESLTWSQVKEMHLTLRVINETMRTSYIGLFLPREPLQDLEFKGYFFPKGWKVYASASLLHLNPTLYPDPYTFNPSRFQDGVPKPNTFIPFGSGNRFCLGSELAKLQMLILIHHLVTKYSWRTARSEYGIRWWPVPIPKDGLVIHVDRSSQSRNHQA